MTKKFDYDNRTYIGATAEDCKVIHLALSEGKKLTIDHQRTCSRRYGTVDRGRKGAKSCLKLQ